MSWNDILISVVSIVLTSLAAWGVSRLTAWLNAKIKDKRALAVANEILDIITTSVKVTYQTYVEKIKGSDLWDLDAQHNALQSALDSAKANLNENAKDYIIKNYQDLDKYLIEKIESTIYDLKND